MNSIYLRIIFVFTDLVLPLVVGYYLKKKGLMGKSQGQTPLPVEYIKPTQFYFDACYNPAKTQFLINAEAKGCKILNGLDMSLYQGVAQIELWTGKKAPSDAMKQELLDILEGK